jgi:hypothetical protein
VTFARLTRGDWLAAVAALALMLVMALDWYSTDAGVDARRIEQRPAPRGALAGEVDRRAQADAKLIADRAEANAWQAEPAADRVILFTLLATAALALAAAWLRAANVRFDRPLTPSALTALVALAAVLLLAARIVQKPGAEPGAVVKLGAPLGLVCAGAVALGARAAWRAERDGSAWAVPQEPAADAAEGSESAAPTIRRP